MSSTTSTQGTPSVTSNALRPDGTRLKLHPLEAKGRYSNAQRIVYPLLIAFYAALPWVDVGGHPAVWLDISHRRFYLFGLTFNASDFHLAFFVLSGLFFLLVVLSALAGRLWCGWACPQTVFLEGVYRRIEAWVEGPARERRKRDQGPWTRERVVRLVTKHVLFVVASLIVTHIFIAYFASVDDVIRMVQRPPSENLPVFMWMIGLTGILYFNFAWFREQFCLVVCPYGRLQSTLADQHTLNVGYDVGRGEPRGKKGTTTGDCVDCRMCVQVCPTGIDIRNGLQLECIGCAHCIDACDNVMVQIGKPVGLIRYDSLAGLRKEPKRFWRGRVYGYLAAGLAGLCATSIAIALRADIQANLMRAQQPRQVVGKTVVHRLVMHVTSKTDEAQTLRLEVDGPEDAELIIPNPSLELPGFENRHVPIMVVIPTTAPRTGDMVKVRVKAADGAVLEERSLAL